MSYTLVENDTGVSIKVTCVQGDPAQAINLVGCTVQLRWKVAGTVTLKPMVVVDALHGLVSYDFAAGEIKPPEMEFEVIITDQTSKTRTSLASLRERVREHLS